MDEELKQRIEEMNAQGTSIRGISKSLGIDRKTVRRALGIISKGVTGEAQGRPKLDPFRDLIRQKAEKDLSGPRILREIREEGYEGGRSILNDFLREIRGPRKRKRKVVRRFETARAEEAQVDWSPYRVPIAGKVTTVHCFSMILCYSRMMFIAFYRNEKLPTLLHAHNEAFEFFGGIAERIVYDNMATVTVGRIGREPIWNDSFLAYSKHVGFNPFACLPRDPDRKGKVERPFRYIHSDFIKESSFDSWEDLMKRAKFWLDTVANVREHSTTGRIVSEMFAEEKSLLIDLPGVRYATDRREVRKVATDGTVTVDGSFYPVPAHLVGQHVAVLVSPYRVNVMDAKGKVVISHQVPDRPTRIPSSIEWVKKDSEPVSRSQLEARFLARFPEARSFLEGLHRRMKGLLPVHLRRIESLAELYGDEPVRSAIERAQDYHNHNAMAIQRILEKAHPDVFPEPSTAFCDPASLGALDDIDSGSPDDYDIDGMAPIMEGAPS